jgi:hypothetical protein
MDDKLQHNDYNEILSKKSVKEVQNNNLQLYNGIMSNISIKKNILTASHTKYKVSSGFSTCIPLNFEQK